MDTPRASIIVPVYNRRDTVGEAIDSALMQTVADVEVIVVDDGSTDGTAEAVRKAFGGDARVVLLTKENGGTASARNEGLPHARGTYVGFLDSDDRYLPEFLAHQIAALEAHPAADMALCDVRYVGAWPSKWTTVFARRAPPLSLDDMLAGGWFIPVGMLLRREAAQAIRFDTETYFEDTDFLFRFFAAGHGAVPVPQVLAEYVKQAATEGAPQKTEERLRIRKEMLLFQERYAAQASDPAAQEIFLHRRWTKYLLATGDRAGASARASRWWRARPWSPQAAWAWIRTRIH
jgi:glycosyltransferase involved in cell wall biosynthesis